MLEKKIAQRIREELSNIELVGLYIALMQIRFIALTYEFGNNIEDEIDSIIMKQVFYRHFEESTGKLLEKIYEVLIDIFNRNPELKKPNIRNRFIEIYEEEISGIIRRIYLKFVKPWLVPEPWRYTIKNVLDKVSRREYTLNDQTMVGTVSIWEGELISDVHTLQNLSLLEKYLLIGNICMFGYNVYLVFPFYVQEHNFRTMLELPQLRLIVESTKNRELIDSIEDALRVLYPSIKVEYPCRGMLRILKDMYNGMLALSIVDIEQFNNIDEAVNRIPQNDIAIILNRNRKKLNIRNRYNTFIVDVADRKEEGLLKLLEVVSKFLK